MSSALQRRLERIGYTTEQASNAVNVHAQMGKLFDLEEYISFKENILGVLG